MKRSQRIIQSCIVTVVSGSMSVYRAVHSTSVAYQQQPAAYIFGCLLPAALAGILYYWVSGILANRRANRLNATSPGSKAQTDIDDRLYDQVAIEIQEKTIIPGLWTKAYAESDGDEVKARAFYIKSRVAQLAAMAAEQQKERKQEAGFYGALMSPTDSKQGFVKQHPYLTGGSAALLLILAGLFFWKMEENGKSAQSGMEIVHGSLKETPGKEYRYFCNITNSITGKTYGINWGSLPSQADIEEAAFQFCKTDAERGDAKAQYALGRDYYYGYGVDRNFVEAKKWFRMAAAQGNEDAQMSLTRLKLN